MMEFSTSRLVKARKDHKCYLCRETIAKGEKYVNESGKYDGEFFYHHLHLNCTELINIYCRESRYNEWAHDWVCDWLRDRYCDCPPDDDCEVNIYRCPKILSALKISTDAEVNAE